jgi:hypothetical protein
MYFGNCLFEVFELNFFGFLSIPSMNFHQEESILDVFTVTDLKCDRLVKLSSENFTSKTATTIFFVVLFDLLLLRILE